MSQLHHLARLTFLMLSACPTLGAERIHLWVKAFIPNVHPSNPGYVKPVPGPDRMTMIPGPIQGAPTAAREYLAQHGLDGCYLTDNRAFHSDPKAKARLTTEFVVIIDGKEAHIEKAQGREVHRCDETVVVDCRTGRKKKASQGAPKAAVTGERFGIGGPHVSEDLIQVIFQSAAENPLAPPGTPDIDYSMDITYNRRTKSLSFQATVGQFPAFEAYVARNESPPVKLFTIAPSGDTVWTLWDLGTGFRSRALNGTVDLK